MRDRPLLERRDLDPGKQTSLMCTFEAHAAVQAGVRLDSFPKGRISLQELQISVPVYSAVRAVVRGDTQQFVQSLFAARENRAHSSHGTADMTIPWAGLERLDVV